MLCCTAEPDDVQPSSSTPADVDEGLQDMDEEQDVPARKRKAAVFDSDEEEDAAPVQPPQQTGTAAIDNDMADIFGSDDD